MEGRLAAHKKYLEEDCGYGVQSLLRPGLKPVNDCVVDQPRKVTAARAQRLTHGGHGQNHVQVVAALQHKLCPAGILAVIGALLHSLQSIDVPFSTQQADCTT